METVATMEPIEKTKIIVIPEEHSSSEVTEAALVPIVKEYIDTHQFDLRTILNVSEGKTAANFYNLLYKAKDKSKTLSMVEEGKAALEDKIFICIKYLSAILIETESADTLLQMDPITVQRATGINNHPVNDPKYINVIIGGYGLNTYINYEEDIKKERQSFYHLLNTIIALAINPKLRYQYETAIHHFFAAAKPYFAECSTETINYIEIFDTLSTLRSPHDRKIYITGIKTELRNIRDNILIKRISKIVNERGIKLVIINVGANHYENIKRIISESENMELFENHDVIDSFNSSLRTRLHIGGKNVPWKGWKNEKPNYHQRTIMYKKCGKKCFLGPKKSFPICKKNTCKKSKKGIYAAYIRARQYKKNKIINKSLKLLKKS